MQPVERTLLIFDYYYSFIIIIIIIIIIIFYFFLIFFFYLRQLKGSTVGFTALRRPGFFKHDSLACLQAQFNHQSCLKNPSAHNKSAAS